MSYLYAPLQNRDVLSPTAREENHEANALDPACYQSMAQAREGDHRPLGWGDFLISTFPNRHSVPLVFAARVRAPVIAALQH
jgi:hypothetical protein